MGFLTDGRGAWLNETFTNARKRIDKNTVAGLFIADVLCQAKIGKFAHESQFHAD
jgi:hypothetical protein